MENTEMIQDTPQQTQQTLQTESKKSNVMLIVLCVALFLAGFGLGYITNTFVANSGQTEDYAYESLSQNYNLEDYENFLTRYPESVHAREVQNRMEQLRRMLTEWAQIQEIGTVGDFLNFKANYDDPRFNRLCDIKIDSLDWTLALRMNSREAFETYLRKHPDGTYAAEASVASEAMRKAAETIIDTLTTED